MRSTVVALFTGVYLLAWIVLWVYRWRNPRCSGKLPPGSMGLPLLGETLQFFRRSAILEDFPFVRERMERYGPVFKTSLVGQPAVVLTDPELSLSIFEQEGKLFQLWYPYTFREIFGRQNMGITQGVMHKYVKCLALKLFGIENIKGQLFHDAVEMGCKTLSSWAEQPTVELKDATEALIFHLTAKKLISYDMSETYVRRFEGKLLCFLQGADLVSHKPAWHFLLQMYAGSQEGHEIAEEHVEREAELPRREAQQ